MEPKEMTSAYRLAHWSGIMKDRTETGESIKAYCERTGIHESRYFYWQKKLRETARKDVQQAVAAQSKAEAGNTYEKKPKSGESIIPSGWTRCSASSVEVKSKTISGAIPIEIGKCTIQAPAEVNLESLTQICRMLVSLC